jgi:16S rRNA pseudouridine516 synthase
MLNGEDHPCAPAELSILSAHVAELVLTEGRYHQVRRMFASQGLTVTALHRSHFGEYDVAQIEPGKWQDLSSQLASM